MSPATFQIPVKTFCAKTTMSVDLQIKHNDYNDIDQFRESLIGWDTVLTQVAPGKFSVSLTELFFDEASSLSHTITNCRVVDNMTVEDGRLMLVVCFTPNIYCGIEVSAGTLLVFGPGREYLNILPERYEDLTLFSSIGYLNGIGLTIDDDGFNSQRPEQCVFNLSTSQLEGFRQLLRIMNKFDALQKAMTDQGVWAAALHERAVGLFKSVLQQARRPQTITLTSTPSQRLLTARALSYINELGPRNESVFSICNYLGCNTRTLQVAFEKTLAMSPLQYILARRLQFARQDLLKAVQSNMKVTQIAAENGFFHLGRFAQYYNGMYGELPSETISRAHRLSIHDP